MRKYYAAGDYFRMIFNKSALAHGGLFLCLAALVFMLVSRGQTYPLNFAVIFICLFFSVIFQSCFHRIDLKQKSKDIILFWALMMAVILGEIGLIIHGHYNTTLQYARFVHITIKGIGLAAAVVCILCLAEKKHLTVDRVIAFNLSLTVLASSVCVLSMLHDMSLNKTVELWWGKYALLEAGVVVTGTLGSVNSMLWKKRSV